jgi:site-specific DNA-cytosine methylase
MAPLSERDCTLIDNHFAAEPDRSRFTSVRHGKDLVTKWDPRQEKFMVCKNGRTHQGWVWYLSTGTVGTLTLTHPIKFIDLKRTATPRELAAFQGIPDSYILPKRGSVKMLGNAVSVPVAAWAVGRAVGDGPRPSTFIDLCAGMGGFHLGAERAVPEIQCVGYSEIMRAAVRSYETNFPGVPALGDLTRLQEIPEADLVVGGFPCQPFSKAQMTKGTHPKRGMFEHVLRVVKRSGARYVVLENVPNIRHTGRDVLDSVVRTLEGMGFQVEQHLLNSKDFGLRQRRKRLYIVARRAE